MGFRQLRRRLTKRYRAPQSSENVENPISQLVTSMLPRRISSAVSPPSVLEMPSIVERPSPLPKEAIIEKTEKPKIEEPKNEIVVKASVETVEMPMTEFTEKSNAEFEETPKTEFNENPKPEETMNSEQTLSDEDPKSEEKEPTEETPKAEEVNTEKTKDLGNVLIHPPKVELSVQKPDDHSDDYHSAAEDAHNEEAKPPVAVIPKVGGAPPPPPPPPPPMSLREPPVTSIRITRRVEEPKKPEEVTKSGLRCPNSSTIPADLMTELQNRLATRVRPAETVFETEPPKPDTSSAAAGKSFLKPPTFTQKPASQRPTAIPTQRPVVSQPSKMDLVTRTDLEAFRQYFDMRLAEHYNNLVTTIRSEMNGFFSDTTKNIRKVAKKIGGKKSKKPTDLEILSGAEASNEETADTLSAHSLKSSDSD